MLPEVTSNMIPPDTVAVRPPQLLYTLDDVAQALRISRAEVERAVARNLMSSVKIGRLRRVTHSQLVAFCQDLERQSA